MNSSNTELRCQVQAMVNDWGSAAPISTSAIPFVGSLPTAATEILEVLARNSKRLNDGAAC